VVGLPDFPLLQRSPKAGLLLRLLNQGGIAVGGQPLLKILRMEALLMHVSMSQWDVAPTFWICVNVRVSGRNCDAIVHSGLLVLMAHDQRARQRAGFRPRCTFCHSYLECIIFLSGRNFHLPMA
jgi:hypothetical protein